MAVNKQTTTISQVIEFSAHRQVTVPLFWCHVWSMATYGYMIIHFLLTVRVEAKLSETGIVFYESSESNDNYLLPLVIFLWSIFGSFLFYLLAA